ncbi:acetyltransferase [Mycolicibacterium litorale]|nr:acetyltransferase [Mycolicibacterium litorale]
MSVRIMPLRLEAFEQLPKHARRCVFWEVDPATLGTGDYLPDPEFEKEAWLSMVMLEWGSCGQIAAATPAEGLESDGEDSCLGYILYAPPRAVPRAQRFPTGPVSADAVLLTSMGIEPGQGAGLTHSLVTHVVTELVRRGVRALEAFGRTAEAAELLDPAAVDPELRPAVEVLGDCSFDQCMIEADFLLDAGFTVVAPHRYFPRLRLELDKGLGWKAEVEAALERLLESAQLQQPVGAGAEIRG